ncbi:hypothetical protein EUTSA_v10021591mg [Eutrema salsugineum]|uniref:Uncharacterized protein n=1 Tax=Eutrema salsugineum TaxID=72664 RepID=V4LFS5_EUTSA|nr:uncharacterized protein LOC18024865 [Eutrema salsugineum]ESQ49350.1 hypothetical protein EUTSA_v10021591mg [Eutrema salsugineum]
MSNNSPIFPIPDSQHFSDYGFDPQIDYFQVMEEARKHKRSETSAKSSINGLHFKLQKPISKDDPTRSTMHNKRKKRWWWKKAFPFFKWRKWPISTVCLNEDRRSRNYRAVTGSMSMSGPIYATESRSGSSTPYRMTTLSRSSSGPIAGTLTPARKGDVAIPYLSLRELTMEPQQQRISTSSSPIYLVT